ncbi:protein ENHANCED DISEASE RESISTANCE 2 [Carica papaya]|uniref:protein ENHANCED DISEASE RESISTANCE 2 n=1 Tax=Carica papaya TaxID=3649 RepID=UPI000B8D0DB6|nr:protein ENHANCED DISEASE RESISTANCE 2 [Carica papaya]
MEKETAALKKVVGEGSEKDGSDSSGSSSSNNNSKRNNSNGGGGKGGEERGVFEYFGWVYHLGTNSIGHEYCHLRFLFIRGKYVEMYKRDPHENLGIKPIRRGVMGPTLMVEELGRRRVNHGDVYVIRFYSRLDEAKKGEVSFGFAQFYCKLLLWVAEYELSTGGSTRNKLNIEAEINLDGHRPRVRRYAYGLRKLIKIGQGPESLLRQSSNLGADARTDGYFERDTGDAIEPHEWKCVRTIDGIRIFEDVANSKSDRGVLVKSVGVIDSSADTVFEVILNLDRHQRYEWDMLTGDLELVDSYDENIYVIFCIYCRWQSKRDFVFSRQWFRGQDGTYTILQFPAVHKKQPPRSGYRRTKINPSTWEIRSLNTPMGSDTAKCLVTQMLEIHCQGWCKWKKNSHSKFEKSIPYALLIQVAGLKEFIGANPALKYESSTTVLHSKLPDISSSMDDYEDVQVQDQFYDATDSSSEEEDSDDDQEQDKKEIKVKLKNVSWAIQSLALKRTSAVDASKELDSSVAPINIDLGQFQGTLQKGKSDSDSNCWTSPSGMGFMIRGKTYLKDNSKIMGGDPLLKLIAVDWFKVDEAIDKVALHPRCLVQSEAGKKLPFILVVNLQVCILWKFNSGSTKKEFELQNRV